MSYLIDEVEEIAISSEPLRWTILMHSLRYAIQAVYEGDWKEYQRLLKRLATIDTVMERKDLKYGQ